MSDTTLHALWQISTPSALCETWEIRRFATPETELAISGDGLAPEERQLLVLNTTHQGNGHGGRGHVVGSFRDETHVQDFLHHYLTGRVLETLTP